MDWVITELEKAAGKDVAQRFLDAKIESFLEEVGRGNNTFRFTDPFVKGAREIIITVTQDDDRNGYWVTRTNSRMKVSRTSNLISFNQKTPIPEKMDAAKLREFIKPYIAYDWLKMLKKLLSEVPLDQGGGVTYQ